MANPNVIDYAQFGKHARDTSDARYNKPANSYAPATNNYWFVREEEGQYDNQQLLDKIRTLLEKPLWPQFPDGAYLNPTQAARLYRATQGIQALTHILDRSAHARDLTKDYTDEPDHSLSELQESQLRMALIEIGKELVNLSDDLHQRSMENS